MDTTSTNWRALQAVGKSCTLSYICSVSPCFTKCLQSDKLHTAEQTWKPRHNAEHVVTVGADQLPPFWPGCKRQPCWPEWRTWLSECRWSSACSALPAGRCHAVAPLPLPANAHKEELETTAPTQTHKHEAPAAEKHSVTQPVEGSVFNTLDKRFFFYVGFTGEKAFKRKNLRCVIKAADSINSLLLWHEWATRLLP